MGVVHILKPGRKRRPKQRGWWLTRLFRNYYGFIVLLILVGIFQLHQSGVLGSVTDFEFLDSFTPVEANIISGRASVVDGDTITINGQRIRLHGIDAPEISQLCADESGNSVQCGIEASRFLRRFLQGHSPTKCVLSSRDRYGRTIANCYRADGKGLAAAMVRAGHALDWPRYSNGAYALPQIMAKAEKRGIWAGHFEKPWLYRTSQNSG